MWTADRFPEVLLAEAPLGELAPAAADTASDPYTHLRCDWVVELDAWREAHDKEGREVNASGVLAAQSLAHTWPGARRAILCLSALPLGQSGDPWPAGWPTGHRDSAARRAAGHRRRVADSYAPECGLVSTCGHCGTGNTR
jgi:hypothetical protein